MHDAKTLRQLAKHGRERALARLLLASLDGRGIRLTAEEVRSITASGLDDALTQRLINEAERLAELEGQ